jgi:tetratricopeptide (TPR) repeat protein
MKHGNQPTASTDPPGVGQDYPSVAGSFGPREWLLVAALAAADFVVYQPAWHGGLLWDDDAHITHPELRSWHGLYRIWFDVGATQQYYPLSETAFWVQYKLWGNWMMGYHLVNIAFHALTAVLVVIVLRQLAIPGAFWAAAIFSLHPVHVESVAWVTEQKNTISAVFYLGAALGSQGRLDEAIAEFDRALTIKPEYADARNNLGFGRSQREDIRKGLARQRELLGSRPDDAALLSEVAWRLATDPNASIRNGTEALELAERAARLTEGREPNFLDTLAAALAEARRFSEAVKTAEQALALASDQHDTALAEAIRARVKLYQSGVPFHESQRRSSP